MKIRTVRGLGMAGLAVALAWGGWGCLAAGVPRSAEIAPPGELGWEATLPITTLGFGRLEGQATNDQGELETTSLGGSFTGVEDPSSAAGVVPFWWEGSLRVGVWPGCELGGLLGIFRLGGEARCGLWSQKAGDPTSLALGGLVGAAPFQGDKGPWWRGSLEWSHRQQWVEWMAGLSLSMGPEQRIMLESPPVRLWDSPPDPNVADAPSPQARVTRREARLSVPLGVGLTEEGGPVQVVLGIVPYWVVWASPTLKGARCAGCRAFQPTNLEEDFGLSLTLGIAPVW